MKRTTNCCFPDLGKKTQRPDGTSRTVVVLLRLLSINKPDVAVFEKRRVAVFFGKDGVRNAPLDAEIGVVEADAAVVLGVSRGRVSQLVNA